MRSNHDEVELKLTVLDPGAIRELVLDPAPGLPGVVPLGPARSIEVEDRYLDTAGGALRRAGLVARVRVSAEPPRLTVKSLARRGQGAVHRRLEVEGTAGDGDDPRGWPPSEALDLLVATIGGATLTTLASLRQVRLQRDVAVGRSRVELSLDEVEVVRPDGGLDRWVELEGELRSGDEADLAGLGALLAGRPGLEPATTSKLDRALGAGRSAITER
jgi:inorganic triphosphatase YgiF